MGKCLSTKKIIENSGQSETKKQGLMIESVPSQKEHYANLDKTEKQIVQPDGGFFAFPHAVKGETKPNIRKTITFYFDTEEEYEIATTFFDKNKSFHKLPYMDTTRLMKLLEANKNA